MEDTLIRDTIRDKKLANSLSSTSSPPSSALKFKLARNKPQSQDPYKNLLKEVRFFLLVMLCYF